MNEDELKQLGKDLTGAIAQARGVLAMLITVENTALAIREQLATLDAAYRTYIKLLDQHKQEAGQ